MKITPEARQKIEAKKVSNVLEKVYKKKQTPTAREEAILAQAAEVQTPGNAGYVGTWDELATELGVDRRTLTNFRERHAKQISELDRTLNRADGRHCVAEWRKFADEFGELRGKGINNEEIDYVDERQLRLRRERFQLAKAEWEFEKAKDLMLPVAQFEAGLAVMVGNFRGTTNLLPGRAAGKIVRRARAALLLMLKGALTGKQFEKVEEIVQAAPIEFADVEEILQGETDILLRGLESCDYLKPPA